MSEIQFPAANGEEWRPVVGFEGFYAVSNEGRVLSLERRCDCGGNTRRVRQRLLKIKVRKKPDGTITNAVVNLSRPEGLSEGHGVGRLVLIAFVGLPKEDQVAHYKDGNRTNARLENLEWSTYSAIAVKVGCIPPWQKRRLLPEAKTVKTGAIPA